MTPLSLDAPLANLRALAGTPGRPLSHRALGERLAVPVSDAAVVKQEARGPRIRLATLAAYARAAGYVLWVGVSGETAAAERPLRFIRGNHSATVEQAREVLTSLGLEMTLAVELAEGSGS